MIEKPCPKLIYIAPILVSLVISILCAHLIMGSSMQMYPVTPFPENPAGSFGNGLYFVLLAGIGASVIYILLKRRNLKLIAIMIGFAFTAAGFLLSYVYLNAIMQPFSVQHQSSLVLACALPLTVILDYVIFKTNGIVYALSIMILGGGLGAFLGTSIPSLSSIAILILLSVYDIFAVYRGPLGKIAKTGLEQVRGLTLPFADIEIGLGDLTFYSMLTSLVFTNAGFVLCLASAICILTGVYLSLRMLQKRGIFPGLPVPVALGLAPLILWLLT